MAGIGLIGAGCARVNTYVAAMSPPRFDFSALPVTIARDDETDSDRIGVTYGGSAFGNSPTSLAFTMTRSSDPLSVENGNGFAVGDVILLSQGPASRCSLLRASGAAVPAGGVWRVPHAAPPEDIFPGGGYATGARVANMGALVRREYFVENGSLMMRELGAPDSTEPPVNPVPLVSGVVALRAQYGRDPASDGNVRFDLTPPASTEELVAIRIAVVARSSQRERETVSEETLRLWHDATEADGGVLKLKDEEARRYRYRVYQTVIPLRNVIWNKP